MISVQVTDENVIDSLEFELVLSQLQLGAFTAVHQHILVVNVQQLRGWIPFQRGCCRAASQYGHFEFHRSPKSGHWDNRRQFARCAE